jgi:hypothetical protein
MPSVMDTPTLLEHVETDNLPIERPQARGARPRSWRALAHGIATYLTHTLRERHAPWYRARRPFETPMDLLVREYPSLSVYALAII